MTPAARGLRVRTMRSWCGEAARDARAPSREGLLVKGPGSSTITRSLSDAALDPSRRRERGGTWRSPRVYVDAILARVFSPTRVEDGSVRGFFSRPQTARR